MAGTLSSLSLICYIAAAVLFVVSIVLFVALRIPKTYSDFTGRTARKKVMTMRANNAVGAGSLNVAAKPVASASGQQSAAVGKEKNKSRKKDKMKSASKTQQDNLPETGLIAENLASTYDDESTELLVGPSDEPSETTVMVPIRNSSIKLKMIEEVLEVHTDEVIR